jgi:hypothetical protein
MVVATRPNTSNIHRRFSPHDLGNLELWFAADHISASDADKIATWADSSGNGRDAAQATADSKPEFKTNIVNGLPVLRFDGTDDYMTISDFVFSVGVNPTGLSVFVVAEYDAIPPIAYPPIIGHFDTNSQRAWSIGGTTLTGRMRGKVSEDGDNTKSKHYKSGSAPAASGDFFIGAMVFGSSALSLYVNGVKENPSKDIDGTVDEIHNSTADLTIGAELNGGSVRANSYMAGDIAEIIVYDQKLDDGERSRVERYLSNKYDINVFNPADIPDIKRWYSAEQIPGLADGAAVPTWDDWHLEVASTDDDASNGASSAQPLWKQNIQNGRPGVKFDGSDDQLLNTNGPNVSAMTIAWVARVTATGSSVLKVVASEWSTGHRKWFSRIDGLERASLTTDPTGTNTSTVSSVSTTRYDDGDVILYVATHPGEVGYQVLRTNMVQEDSDLVADMFTSDTSDFRIGSISSIQEYNDYIFEIIIFDRVLNSKEIDALEGYLNDKYEVV